MQYSVYCLNWNCLLASVNNFLLIIFGVARGQGSLRPSKMGVAQASVNIMKEMGWFIQLLWPHPIICLYAVPCMNMMGCLLVWLWSPCAYALCTKANSLAGCSSNTEYCNTVRGFLSYEESQHLNIEIHRRMVESCDTVAFILARHITMF